MVHWLCLSHRGVYQMASMEHPWLCMLGASSLFTLVTKMGAAWRHSGPAPGMWIPCLKKNPGKTGVTPMIHGPNYVNSSLKLGFWRYYIYIYVYVYTYVYIYIYVYIRHNSIYPFAAVNKLVRLLKQGISRWSLRVGRNQIISTKRKTWVIPWAILCSAGMWGDQSWLGYAIYIY